MLNELENAIDKRKHYHKKGIIFLPNLLSEKPALKNLQTKIFTMIKHRSSLVNHKIDEKNIFRKTYDQTLLDMYSIDPKNVSYIYDVMRYTTELFTLLTSDFLLDEIANLFETKKEFIVSNNHNLRIDLPGDKWSENLPWHQDWPYNNPLYLNQNSIASWISVFDTPLECGPLEIKESSHLMGEMKHEEINSSEKYERKNHLVYGVPEEYLDNKKYPTHSVPCKEGDVILFDLNLIHKSGINKSQLIRWSAQARYHNVMNPDFLPKYKINI